MPVNSSAAGSSRSTSSGTSHSAYHGSTFGLSSSEATTTAIAAEAGTPAYADDSLRPLTDKGKKKMQKIAQGLKELGARLDLILTSPLLRAVQTADILAETISYEGPLIASNNLAPGFDMTELGEFLASHRSANELVLVGHEPDLSDLVVSLLSLADSFKFKKGTALMVKIDPAELHAQAGFKWLASGKKLITSAKEAFSQ